MVDLFTWELLYKNAPRVPRRPQHHVTSVQESQRQNALAEHGAGWRLVKMVRHDLNMSGLGPSFRRFCSSFNAQRMNFLPHAALNGHARPPPSFTPTARSPSSTSCLRLQGYRPLGLRGAQGIKTGPSRMRRRLHWDRRPIRYARLPGIRGTRFPRRGREGLRHRRCCHPRQV